MQDHVTDSVKLSRVKPMFVHPWVLSDMYYLLKLVSGAAVKLMTM
jgi:hypothetical protein